MATIQEVAELAGVSTATVSRVLNNNYTVSDKRRAAVMDAVKALNYRPNIIGRNLSRSENKTILVVSTIADNSMLAGVHHAAKERGFDVILSYTGMSGVTDSLKYFENGLAGGMIFINFMADGETVTDVIKNYPVVQCAEYMDNPESYLVSVRDDVATYELTEMLIRSGRKKLFFLTLRSWRGYVSNYSIMRASGFVNALKDNGIAFSQDLIHRTKGRYTDVVEVAKQIAALDPSLRPDGIVCATDLLGAACVNTFRNLGISVPETIAVTGFDDSQYSSMCTPLLTTVRQPFFDMGAESVKMLISIMSGNKPENRRLFLPHSMVIRGSTDITKV